MQDKAQQIGIMQRCMNAATLNRTLVALTISWSRSRDVSPRATLVAFAEPHIEKPCMNLVTSNSSNAIITNNMIGNLVMRLAVTTDLSPYGGKLR